MPHVVNMHLGTEIKIMVVLTYREKVGECKCSSVWLLKGLQDCLTVTEDTFNAPMSYED